ncbi:hypothetical protein Goshw_009276 [Gossypium schwendimanii]|uniref:Uncharacterized protein n=1 Tax=Gossypium schwendimanii TaxID=34291 RepID=A0A7J9NIF3_GOSSC|nr:hypothetical protein [Gossypium schwendimanii]
MGEEIPRYSSSRSCFGKESISMPKRERGVKVRVTELEKSLHQHHSRNFTVELKVSLSKIEELRGKERLDKIQQDMLESQKAMMNQLS